MYALWVGFNVLTFRSSLQLINAIDLPDWNVNIDKAAELLQKLAPDLSLGFNMEGFLRDAESFFSKLSIGNPLQGAMDCRAVERFVTGWAVLFAC